MPGELVFLLWYLSGFFITIKLMKVLAKQIAKNAGVKMSPIGGVEVFVAFFLALLGPLNLMGCVFLDGDKS